MTDKEFEKLMEQKRIEASKPGYGARCAAKAAKARKRNGDKSARELMLS